MPDDRDPEPRPEEKLPPDEPDPLVSSITLESMPELTTSMELVAKYQQGDGDALDRLLERYQDRIRRIVRIKLGSRLREHVDSMDIVQEANIVAARKLGQLELRNSASILNWLSEIVLNQIRDANDYYHAKKRDVDKQVPLEVPSSSGDGVRVLSAHDRDQPLPEELAWHEELREILDESMTRLSPEYREVILLRDYYGGDWEYVTAQLGKPNVQAAQQFWRRAWIKLRRIVRPRLVGLL